MQHVPNARLGTAPSRIAAPAVFLVSAALYTFVHRAQLFVDPDGLYHLKMAQLISQHGLVRDFTWLPYTTLAHAFADHHLLYHLLLIPFVQLLGPLNGAMVATVAFASLAVLAFYVALRTHRARWPLLFTLMLATSYSTMVRLNLTKANALSVTVVLVSLVAYRLRRPLIIFVLAWLYVWLHGGWPLMIAVVGVYWAAGWIVDRGSRPVEGGDSADERYQQSADGGRASRAQVGDGPLPEPLPWRQRDETRMGLAALGGLLCGLVLNPYFPTNLRFYWEQIVQIAIVGYGQQIAVGLEWYPYAPGDFIARNSALINAFLFCGVLAAILRWGGPSLRLPPLAEHREDRVALTASLLLTLFLAVLTARSRRHVEYLAPIGMYSAALLTTHLLRQLDTTALRERLRGWLPQPIERWLPLDLVLAAILLFVAAIYGLRNVVSVTAFYDHGSSIESFKGAATWLKANTPPNTFIVNSDYAQFGPLLYWDDTNRYLCGLDPTFLYRQDPERYWKWLQLITARVAEAGKIGPFVADELGSRYFLVGRNEVEVRGAVEQPGGLIKVYEDGDALIYQVP